MQSVGINPNANDVAVTDLWGTNPRERGELTGAAIRQANQE